MQRNQDPDDLVDRDLTNVRTLVDNDASMEVPRSTSTPCKIHSLRVIWALLLIEANALNLRRWFIGIMT